jgi:TPP-dependent pyruvate/acetoin dehydrogenase alpha subunit
MSSMATLGDKTGESMLQPSTESEPALRQGLQRRAFLKGLGGVAAGVAVFASAQKALAGNGWSNNTDAVPPEKLLDMYTKMLKSRWWEEGIKDVFLGVGKQETPPVDDAMYGYAHLYTGEEAVAGGCVGALNEDDYIASTHRGHGHLIAKGGDLNKMSAEIFFREGGYNQGYGGSMHITDMSKGILGMNGIVGPAHLLAAGAAYGIKTRGTKQVAMSFGGDGSVNNGWFYCGLRNAALYKLPFIAVIENNGYQVTTPTEFTNPVRDLSTLGKGLEIPSFTVNGQDILEVYSVAKAAVDRARAGLGPTLIEAKTYRYYDHAGMSRSKIGALGAYGLPYRSDAEMSAWIAKDPVPLFRNTLIAMGVIDAKKDAALVADVKKQVADSINFARKSPMPKREMGVANVYAHSTVNNPCQQFA